jgi:hypothetical protein
MSCVISLWIPFDFFKGRAHQDLVFHLLTINQSVVIIIIIIIIKNKRI